jgi:CDP-paratose 2-epimerase
MRLIGDVRGTPPEFDLAPWRPGDQPWYVSDIRSISAALDWQPRMSVGRGLRALAAWLDERWPDSGSSRREARA